MASRRFCDVPQGLSRFAAKFHVEPGRTLVVGSKLYPKKPDRRKMYEDALGLDIAKGRGVDLVHDLEKPLPDKVGKFSHVDCVSVLEHVRRPWLMAENIESVMEPEATILVCVPFVWRVHSYPSDYWRITPSALGVLFPCVEWLGICYLIDGYEHKLVRGKREGGVWMQRAEVAGFGVRKCDSIS